MKKKSILMVLSCIVVTIGYGQELSDNNSALINAYFSKPNNDNTSISITAINQIGRFNTSSIQTSTKKNISIYQQGNFNGYFFISGFGKSDFNLDVIQQGEHNSIHIFGENDLMKNATIRQTGTDKDIIITNN